jgi:hypothetical protein
VDEYRREVQLLTDTNERSQNMQDMKEYYGEMRDLINKTEDERKRQVSAISEFLSILEVGKHPMKIRQEGVQTDLRLIQTDGDVLTAMPNEAIQGCHSLTQIFEAAGPLAGAQQVTIATTPTLEKHTSKRSSKAMSRTGSDKLSRSSSI